MTLPPLTWKPSPNFNSRNGTKIDLIVIHDMEGSFAGSVSWLDDKRSHVSAHFGVNEDGTEIAQMVRLDARAWHACDFNSRSVGIEMAGFAKNGFSDKQVNTVASLTAWLCHYLQIPVRHAKGGSGAGIESHWGLGRGGGGHSDPSTDPAWMDRFVELVGEVYGTEVYDPKWINGLHLTTVTA